MIIVISNFTVKKVYYYGTDLYGLLFNCGKLHLPRSFNLLALKYCGKNSFRKSIVCILLLMCGDVERCPGPTGMSDLLTCRGMKLFHQNIRT